MTEWHETKYYNRRVYTGRGPARVVQVDDPKKPTMWRVQLDTGRVAEYPTDGIRFHAVDDSYRDRYAIDKTVRTNSGSPSTDCADQLAIAMRGLVLGELEQVAHANGLADWYSEAKKKLNPGMLRMGLGNRLRPILRRGGQVKIFNTIIGSDE